MPGEIRKSLERHSFDNAELDCCPHLIGCFSFCKAQNATYNMWNGTQADITSFCQSHTAIDRNHCPQITSEAMKELKGEHQHIVIRGIPYAVSHFIFLKLAAFFNNKLLHEIRCKVANTVLCWIQDTMQVLGEYWCYYLAGITYFLLLNKISLLGDMKGFALYSLISSSCVMSTLCWLREMQNAVYVDINILRQ